MTRYEITVHGIAWVGYKASTVYTFHQQQPPTRPEVIAKAGDFQAVTRISALRVDTNVSRVKLSA